MAKDGMGTLLGVGIVGGLAYWGYTQGWFASFFGSAAASPNAAGGSASTPSSPPALPPASPTSTGGAGASSYSGPSLDQMFQSLQSVVQAAVGSDSALSCGGGSAGSLSGLGARPGVAPRPDAGSPSVGVLISRGPSASSGIAPNQGIVTNKPRVSGSCSNPEATYDVFNWYLVNAANVGVSSAPNPPDHTSVISLSDYWTWAAPQLKQMMPGLAGGFNGGLGAYAELGRILQMQAGGR